MTQKTNHSQVLALLTLTPRKALISNALEARPFPGSPPSTTSDWGPLRFAGEHSGVGREGPQKPRGVLNTYSPLVTLLSSCSPWPRAQEGSGGTSPWAMPRKLRAYTSLVHIASSKGSATHYLRPLTFWTDPRRKLLFLPSVEGCPCF